MIKFIKFGADFDLFKLGIVITQTYPTLNSKRTELKETPNNFQ